MTIRLIRQGQQTNIAESHYVIDEGDIKPVNSLDGDGNIITKIITGSELIENLVAGGINKYIFSEKSNSWNKIEYKGNTTTNITFQNAVTTIGNGTDFVVGTNKTLRVDIYGTATTKSVNFYHVNCNGDLIPIQGYNISTASLATSTSGTSAETWIFDVTALNKIRMSVSAISGGNLTVIGMVVS